jgi:hypothetical protein
LVSNGAVHRVGLEVRVAALASVDNHGAIAGVIVAHASAVGAVDGDLVVVRSDTVAVGVGVVEEATLEHAIVGGFNTGHQVGGRESGLLGLSMVVLGVAVEGDLADGDKRVVAVRPDLGDVKNIKAIVSGVLFGHCLHVPSPAGMVSLCNFSIKIVGGPLRVLLSLLGSFFSSEVLDSLISLVVRLDVVDLSLVVNPFEGVGGVTIHVAVSIGGSAVTHEDGDLVEGFGLV